MKEIVYSRQFQNSFFEVVRKSPNVSERTCQIYLSQRLRFFGYVEHFSDTPISVNGLGYDLIFFGRDKTYFIEVKMSHNVKLKESQKSKWKEISAYNNLKYIVLVINLEKKTIRIFDSKRVIEKL